MPSLPVEENLSKNSKQNEGFKKMEFRGYKFMIFGCWDISKTVLGVFKEIQMLNFSNGKKKQSGNLEPPPPWRIRLTNLVHKFGRLRNVPNIPTISNKVTMQQCYTNIKIFTEYEYEYIRKWNFHRIRILNIFITR